MRAQRQASRCLCLSLEILISFCLHNVANSYLSVSLSIRLSETSALKLGRKKDVKCLEPPVSENMMSHGWFAVGSDKQNAGDAFFCLKCFHCGLCFRRYSKILSVDCSSAPPLIPLSFSASLFASAGSGYGPKLTTAGTLAPD